MTRHRRLRAALVLTTTVVATALLAGCDKAEEAVNKGGDTPCSEFVQQDQNKQRVTVRKYLKNDTKVSETASPDTVDHSISAIMLMCRAQANPDTPIREADLSGILVPKK